MIGAGAVSTTPMTLAQQIADRDANQAKLRQQGFEDRLYGLEGQKRALTNDKVSLENSIQDIQREIDGLTAQGTDLDRNQGLQLQELNNQRDEMARQLEQLDDQIRNQGEELNSQLRSLDDQARQIGDQKNEINDGKIQTRYEESRQRERELAANRQRNYANTMWTYLVRDNAKYCGLTKHDAMDRQQERDDWLTHFQIYMAQLAAKQIMGELSTHRPQMPSTRQVRPFAGDPPNEQMAISAAKQTDDADAAVREGAIGLRSRYDQTRAQEEKIAAAERQLASKRRELSDKQQQVADSAALSRKKIAAAGAKVDDQEQVIASRYETSKDTLAGKVDRFNNRIGQTRDRIDAMQERFDDTQNRIDDTVGRMEDGGVAATAT